MYVAVFGSYFRWCISILGVVFEVVKALILFLSYKSTAGFGEIFQVENVTLYNAIYSNLNLLCLKKNNFMTSAILGNKK